MSLIRETGQYYSPTSDQTVFYRERVEGMPFVRTTGNWFYNYETDRFITKYKLMQKIEADEMINNSNKN